MMTLNGMRKAFRHSGKWILGIATLAMLVTAFTGIGANIIGGRSLSGGSAAKDPAVVTVNGTAITRSQFDQALTKLRQQNAMMQQPESVMNAAGEHAQVLTELINNQLFQEIAQKNGITASSDDIEGARQQQFAGLRKELGLPTSASEDQINAALQQRSLPSVDQLIPDDQIRPQVVLQKY
ncbi:MAG TPA: SurA N-terminal domain-containing protein, partial [Capsulimonadaceae bacterium]|nr:SurA N-terminal domain-containing protein [Capsulimonadaceae bacterium]